MTDPRTIAMAELCEREHARGSYSTHSSNRSTPKAHLFTSFRLGLAVAATLAAAGSFLIAIDYRNRRLANS